MGSNKYYVTVEYDTDAIKERGVKRFQNYDDAYDYYDKSKEIALIMYEDELQSRYETKEKLREFVMMDYGKDGGVYIKMWRN